MSSQIRALLPVISMLVLVSLSGCASLPDDVARDPRDPFERYNRTVFNLNQALDRAIARPIAVGYSKITPRPLRLGVSNFLSNLSYPVVVVNDLLQAKVRNAGGDAARFLINTTFGVGGLFDPATKWGLELNNEDLGQTLGKWGVPPGAYVMLPILGPVTVRDGIGDIGDFYMEPIAYIDDGNLQWGLAGLRLLDTRYNLLDTDELLNRAFDPYAFLRSAYLQRREYLIHDGYLSDDEPLDEFDAPPDEAATPPL